MHSGPYKLGRDHQVEIGVFLPSNIDNHFLDGLNIETEKYSEIYKTKKPHYRNAAIFQLVINCLISDVFKVPS